MNKKMREILAKIEEKAKLAKGYMDGETKDVEKAGALLDEVDNLQKEYEVEEKLFKLSKAANEPNDDDVDQIPTKKANGFMAVAKMIGKKILDAAEKALIVSGASGENNLLPEDVKLEINELRKSYKSAKTLVDVVPTSALSGSVNYENGSVVGLIEFVDGAAIDEGDQPGFTRKTFTIGWFGKLIPVSRILAGAEKAGLMGYINRWFLKNAVITENAKIFAELATGKTVKVVKGWAALKSTINKDIDPACLIDGVIVTNQTGFDVLDQEVDKNGRPILSVDPTNPTIKKFNGLTIEVFSDAQLANVSGKAPMFIGSLKAGCTFVEYEALEFATSEHVFFGKNQNCLRVIEGFDVMGTDKDAYIYATFEATPTV